MVLIIIHNTLYIDADLKLFHVLHVGRQHGRCRRYRESGQCVFNWEFNKFHFNGISTKVQVIKDEVVSIQKQLLDDPTNTDVTEMERYWTQSVVHMRAKEESFPRQKSRINWFKCGDKNSKFFHQHKKSRENKSHIFSLMDDSGSLL